MYGDIVSSYDFAVHCFFMIILYCREGQAPPLRCLWPDYAKSEFCNAPLRYSCFAQIALVLLTRAVRSTYSSGSVAMVSSVFSLKSR